MRLVRVFAMAASAVLTVAICGCASQPSGSSSAASASGGSPGDKCEIDVKRICQEMRNAPVVDAGTGQTQDRTEREQNSERTDSRFMSIQVPQGSVVEVQCDINSQHNTVIYAHLMSGPALTPTDVAYFRNGGYCTH